MKMNCEAAPDFLSALYDGEPIPTEFADHVETCPNCRRQLRDYSVIGAELRLLASRSSASPVLPPATFYQQRSRRSRLMIATGKIFVPKLALAAAAALFLVLTASLVRLEARQTNPYWFQFTLTPKDHDASPFQQVAKAGYDDGIAQGFGGNFIGTHIAISAVEKDHVELAVRSRSYPVSNADKAQPKKDMQDLSGHTITYSPGQSIDIPIEGGGTVVLAGQILDHKPRFMIFGIPLEPNANQVILTSPVLIRGDKVLSNMKGANAVAPGPDEEGVVYAPGTGLFKFASQSSPGAIKAEANWGNLEFKLDGQTYTLLCSSQITGGDQPATVWVTANLSYTAPDDHLKNGFVSTDKLSDPHW